MADFALRAAYYLNLPAKGPIPIPRITERWTVPRSHFIFKKSQENWQRITMRRVVQVLDGDPEVVRRWLGFVRRWAWHGVGMKADVWEWEGMEGLGYGKEARAKRDGPTEGEVEEALERGRWELFGRRAGLNSKEEVEKVLDDYGFRAPTEKKDKRSDASPPGRGAKKSAEAPTS